MTPEEERAPLPAVVRALHATASPKELRLERGTYVVGASSRADFVVDDDSVSRRHASLTLTPRGVLVEDLKSSNGTFYLGQRVEKMVLALGSHLRIGDIELYIDADPAALEAGGSGPERYRELLGVSAPMRELFLKLARLEGSLVNILILGESGTGKELIARSIHQGSAVARGPFVPVDCGAIPSGLIASTLFGHRKGAFTGAVTSQVGAFEAANDGTLFLDEIGELPLEAQPALLRALESGHIQPVGETTPRPVRVRVLAATNRDLGAAIEQEQFRQDLYYRLAVVLLQVPPLRDRTEDIEVLVRRFASEAGCGTLPKDVVAELRRRHWPGNARELRNAVQAYIAVGTLPQPRGSSASALDACLRQHVADLPPYDELKRDVIDRLTRSYLMALMSHTGGNQSAAARVSGLERSYLRTLLGRYELL
jgi:DNA-binding NtrC family response regulator